MNGICEAILLGIESFVGANDPKTLTTPIGLVQALLDPRNTSQVTQTIQDNDSGRGHKKSVRIMYKQRTVETEAEDAKTCDDGPELPRLEVTTDITDYKQIKYQVKEATVKQLCDAYSVIQSIPLRGQTTTHAQRNALGVMREVAEDLLYSLDGLRMAINSALHTKAVAALGAFAPLAPILLPGALTTEKTYNLLENSNHNPVLKGFSEFNQDMARSTLRGTPFVVGEGLLDNALAALSVGCCNAGGTDFGQMDREKGMNYYKDFGIGAALGDPNAFLSFLPGMLVMSKWNEYVASFSSKIGTMDRGVIPDPFVPGLMYDMRVRPDECGEHYNVYVGLNFDLVAAPTDMFKDGDRLRGVNGAFHCIAAAV